MSRAKNIKKAVLFGIGFSFFLTVMSLLVKLAAPHTTNSMTVFARFSIAVPYVFVLVAVQRFRGVKVSFITGCFWMHLLRAFSSCLAQLALFYSLRYIPLVDANMLFMTHTLFIPILGAIFLSTATNFKSWMAICIGFFGVVLALKPGAEIIKLSSLIALSSGFFLSVSFLGLHEIGKKDSVYTIMLYYFSLSFLISGAIVAFDWQTPDSHTLLLLLGVGIIGTLSQECAIRALVYAPAKIVAPLMYATIIFSGMADWIFWKHIPGLLTLTGMIFICTGNFLTVIFAKEKAL